MASALQLTLARQTAESLVRKLALASLPIDPFLIAEKHDIIVEPKPDTADGVSGMLLRYGDMFCILYATNIPSDGFQRFSVAHELGHYFLDGHIDHVLVDGQAHLSRAGFASGDSYELEADHFAAGLLMPVQLFHTAQAKFEPGLQAIEALADLCRTSLTATAIRYAELTGESVAVVMSTGQQVDFCRMSETMKSKGHFDWMKRSAPVPRNTATFRFNSDVDRIVRADREICDIDIVEWLGGDRSIPGVEEVIGLGRYGKTLTVLTCPTLEEVVEEAEVDETEEDMLTHWARRSQRAYTP